MGNKSLFPVVAVPPAFFGTFFRFERKYVPLRGGSPTVRAGVGASIPRSRRVNPPESARQSPGVGFLPAKLAHIDAYSWLSARPLQTFGSSAGANQQPNGAASPTPRRSRRVSPPAGECFRQSRRTPTQTGVLPRGKQPARLALSCTPFAAYLNSELFPLVTFRTHRRRVSAAANENDQHVQNTRWSFL